MKRKLLKTAAVIAVICIVIIIAFGLQPVKVRDVHSGEVVLNDNRIPLTTEDAQAIGKLFQGKISSRDNPACGFGVDIVLNCDGELQTFNIGQDSCGLVCWVNGGKYFGLSEKENAWLRELLIGKYDCDGWFYS